MIKINNNTCPICLTSGLSWNLKYSVTQMEMFKCGHGLCKTCYKELKQKWTNYNYQTDSDCEVINSGYYYYKNPLSKYLLIIKSLQYF